MSAYRKRWGCPKARRAFLATASRARISAPGIYCLRGSRGLCHCPDLASAGGQAAEDAMNSINSTSVSYAVSPTPRYADPLFLRFLPLLSDVERRNAAKRAHVPG